MVAEELGPCGRVGTARPQEPDPLTPLVRRGEAGKARSIKSGVVRLVRLVRLFEAEWCGVLRYLTLKEVFWYELPRTLRGLAVGGC